MDIDKETQDMLVNALYRLKEDQYRYEQKREARFWAELQHPLTLQSLLTNYTKYELTEIRQNLELKGLSALKKQELIDALKIGIINSAHKVFSYFDDFHYQLIKKMVKANDSIVKFDGDIEQIEYLRGRGIVFTGSFNGQRVLAMPPELMTAFKDIDSRDFRKKIKRNTEWIHLTQGVLYYYGTLGIHQLALMIEELTNTEISDPWELYTVLFEAALFYKEIRLDVHGFSNCRVFDPEIVLKEHKQRPDLNFFPFSYDQLYKAGAADYIDKNYAFRKMARFLADNYDIGINEADEVVEECVYAIRIGEPVSSIMEFLQQQFEIEEEQLLNEFMEHITFLSNNTRQWFLKGYTAGELSPKDNVIPFPGKNNKKNEKVGRNDPCPCGSGKKYKRCCGK